MNRSEKETFDMPPLDYQYPAEMGGSQVAMPIQQEPVTETSQHSEQMLSLYDLPTAAAPARGYEEQEEIQEETTEEEYTESNEPVEQIAQPIVQQKKQIKAATESWKEVRLAKEKAEQQAKELMSKVIAMQEAQLRSQQQAQQPKPVEVKEWYDELPPEDLTENKHIQRMAQDMRNMKAQLEEQRQITLKQQQEARDAAAVARAKSQYPDMDKVVNKETIDALIELYPTEALEIEAIPNKYTQSVLAYTTIKNLGIYKPTENQMKKPAYESDILRAKVNAAKPRPMASVNPQQGESPLSQVNGFINGYASEDMQAKYRAEMKAATERY
jgi:hypothetical protein